MSATARNYAYIVKVTKQDVKEPTMSKARLEECRKNVAPYLTKEKDNAKKN